MASFNPRHFNLVVISFISFFYWVYIAFKSVFRRKNDNDTDKKTFGVFHPYCNAGGGGERVLWVALRSLQQEYPESHFIIYTGDETVSPDQMISNAKSRFNVEVNPNSVDFVYLTTREWVEAETYPSFTLIGQSIGSIYMGLEALSLFRPDIFIDTMGYAFTLPLFKILGRCKIGCYVHYPTISTDMLERVSNRTESYNNPSVVAKSPVLSTFKLTYYTLFAKLYSSMGRASDVVMVNSSWTENHINTLWKIPKKTLKVYPPCDVEDFKKIPLREEDSEPKEFRIVSVAQFRPEKDHSLQLRSVAKLRETLNPDQWKKVKLVLVGSVRNEGDANRVKDLEVLAQKLDIADHVIFRLNVSFQELKQELADGLIGIHTMWNEHFGIGIVECMAAGLIMVANKSGGPLMDIVTEATRVRNGYLASDEEEYAEVIKTILNLSGKERSDIRVRAKQSVDRFSESEFSKGFLKAAVVLVK